MKIIFKSKFIRAISTLITGSIIAQIISLLVSPIMTRIYTTEEIGIYTLILTGVTIFGSVICGRYDMAIVSERNEQNVYKLVKVSFIFTLIASILISIGYYFFYDIKSIPKHVLSIILFILLLLTGIRNILVSYNNRHREYKLMTTVYVVRSVVKDLLIIVLGIFKLGSFGLILSQIVGEVFGLKKQGEKLIKHLRKIISIPKYELKEVLKIHYKQPVYSVPSMFANNFSYASINLFIENLFGLSVLGLYFLTYKMLGIPLSVISGNVSKVFFQEASREYERTNRYKSSFIKTTVLLSIVAIPMAIVLYFLSPIIFSFVFGNEWKEAGIFVQILAPMFAIRFVVSALSPGMIISKKQNIDLIINSSFIIMAVLCFFIAKLNNFTIYEFLYWITITYSLIYIIAFIIFAKNAFQQVKNN